MKKIILATTVCLLALGITACKDQKKDETSTAQEQVAPAGEENKAEGTAAEMGKKVDDAVTDVKKDVDNAAAAAHAQDAAHDAAVAKDAAKDAASSAESAKDAAAPAH